MLFKAPFRQFDLVRKQVTSSHCVTQAEMTSKGPEPLPRQMFILSSPVSRSYFDDKVVVGVAHEPTTMRILSLRLSSFELCHPLTQESRSLILRSGSQPRLQEVSHHGNVASFQSSYVPAVFSSHFRHGEGETISNRSNQIRHQTRH